MLCSSSLQPFSSYSAPKTLKPSISPPSKRPLYVKFNTTRHENLRYLKSIGVLHFNTKLHHLPSRDALTRFITTINFFKSKGFEETDFSKLTSIYHQLFSLDFDPTDIDPVFQFLTSDLNASLQESRFFILNCPQILFSDVEYCLKPTLNYLRQLRITKLNVPSKLNAKILNTRVEKLHSKVKFMRSLGLSRKEAEVFCARIPAIFGYSIENNLRPKIEYLFEEMERSLEELQEFPQYVGFSLKKRIIPRHLHLKQRNVHIKLNRMLMWSDQRFYGKWK